VARPGTYSLQNSLRVSRAISLAEGFADFADQKNITILRRSERHHFNYRDFIKGKKMEDDIFLEDGDIIEVP
jgi:polysaccharide export outer membrane protein